MAKKAGLRARARSVQAAMTVHEATEPVEEDRVALSIRLSRAQHDALRLVAFEQRRSMNSVVREGLDLVLGKHGKV